MKAGWSGVAQAGGILVPSPRAELYSTTLKTLARLPTSGGLEVNQTGAQLLFSAPRHIWFKFPGSKWEARSGGRKAGVVQIPRLKMESLCSWCGRSPSISSRK